MPVHAQVFVAGECYGIVYSLIYFASTFTPPSCPPEKVTMNQAIQVVAAYMKSVPNRMHERFIDLAAIALQRAWPCSPAPR